MKCQGISRTGACAFFSIINIRNAGEFHRQSPVLCVHQKHLECPGVSRTGSCAVFTSKTYEMPGSFADRVLCFFTIINIRNARELHGRGPVQFYHAQGPVLFLLTSYTFQEFRCQLDV